MSLSPAQFDVLLLTLGEIGGAGAQKAAEHAGSHDAPMTLAEGAIWVSLAILGNLGAALAAGGEMGVYSLNRVRLSLRSRPAAGGRAPADPAAAILREELEHPARLLATLLICYNVFSYLGSVGLTGLLEGSGYGELGIVLLNTFLIGPVLFVLADTVPKEVFRLQADRLTYAIARPLKWARLVLTYTLVLPLVQGAARALSGLLHGADESSLQTARERIATLLKEGAQHGVISETQVGLLDRALALRELTVVDEMTPWSKAIKLDVNMSVARTMDVIAAHPFTRFPVVSSRGGVLGVVETIDLCLAPAGGASLTSLMKPISRLKGDVSVREGLLRLKADGAAMAIVTGPGKDMPLGIVTAKDLVEPLTGELTAY